MRSKNRKLANLVYLLVLAFFVGKMLVFIVDEGGNALGAADSTAESNSIIGARNFVDHGFWRSSGLPDSGVLLNLDSPSKPILESPYYAHYLPGPDYVVALTMAAFGTSNRVFQWTRLIPMLHVLLAAMLFLWALESSVWRGNPWIKCAVAPFLLLAPGMRPWAISLHGHAYTSSYILVGLALGMLAASDKRARFRPTYLMGAFAIGFLSNYMLLTAAFAVCFSPLVGALLVPAERPAPARRGLALTFIVGCGLMAAFGLHFMQVAHQFGLHEAWIDISGTLGARNAKLTGSEPSRVQLLGIYSNHCYTFWGISSLSMLLLAAFLAFIHPDSRTVRRNLFLSVLMAGIGAYGWIMVMKNHALGHGHVNPRIFYLMYAAFLAALGSVAAALTDSRKPLLTGKRSP